MEPLPENLERELDKVVGPPRDGRGLGHRVVKFLAFAALAVGVALALGSFIAANLTPRPMHPGTQKKAIEVQLLPAKPAPP